MNPEILADFRRLVSDADAIVDKFRDLERNNTMERKELDIHQLKHLYMELGYHIAQINEAKFRISNYLKQGESEQ